MDRKEIESRIEELNILMDGFDKSEYEYDFEGQYQEMLDDSHDSVFNILPSRILEELDPIAYNIGLSEYVDNLELSEFHAYNEMTEELEGLEYELELLEEEDNA